MRIEGISLQLSFSPLAKEYATIFSKQLSYSKETTFMRHWDSQVMTQHMHVQSINIFHIILLLARVVAYLSRVLEAAFTALEGLNKQAFLTELVRYCSMSSISFYLISCTLGHSFLSTTVFHSTFTALKLILLQIIQEVS